MLRKKSEHDFECDKERLLNFRIREKSTVKGKKKERQRYAREE